VTDENPLDVAALEATRASAVQTDANRAELLARARRAVAANNAFLLLDPPTQAQSVAQLQRLTRECTALIKLAVGDVADLTGTE
jgi:hypothetical protein